MRNLAAMLLSALFFSCEDPIGIVIDTPSTGGQITTVFTDTIKVAASTVMLDSTFTSGQSAVSIGNYKDPIFGQVTSRTFAQITLPVLESGAFAPLKFPAADSGITVYDSVYIYMAHNGFRYGDSTKNYSMAIHRLTQDFVNTKRYTNEDVLAFNPTPLASGTFSYKELKRASTSSSQDSLLKFKLPTSLGKEIYDLFYKDASTTNEKFVAAVKGLAFIPNSNDQNMYGIALSNSYILLYYHTTTSNDRKSIPLTLYSQRFSQVVANRNGTVLQNLKKLQSIPSNLTNNRTYLQTGTGISPKLTFPTLAALQKNANILINKAELVFEPDLDQINGNYRATPQVALVQLDANNQIKKTSGNLIEFVISDGLTAQYVSNYSSTTNSYTFNITSVLQDLISKKRTIEGMALVPSLLNTTNSTISLYNSDVSRVVMKNIKLNVYYSTKK
ncbi:MAG: DUF4270 domain-containing protein [Emticicia sp.]|uniref:DUF4270 domain-containing protein n=1 Tax=Emticicia sp. TaxID=1930953 RepID=UPI003BA5D447